jgi:hypothetical protein
LNLIGHFRDVKFGEDPCQFDAVLGACQGKDITLHNCLETNRRGVSPQVYSSFFVETAFVGAHFG